MRQYKLHVFFDNTVISRINETYWKMTFTEMNAVSKATTHFVIHKYVPTDMFLITEDTAFVMKRYIKHKSIPKQNFDNL